MNKKTLGSKLYLFPSPTILIGSKTNGKENYFTAGICGPILSSPALITITVGKERFTYNGIKEYKTFSVNIPSAEMVKITDYFGLVSGKDIDKTKYFNTFYGKLNNAPMIEECPLNLECRLVQSIDYGSKWDVVIGEIVETYVSEECLTNGKPDLLKIDPILFSLPDWSYWRVGQHLAKAGDIGKTMK